MKCAVGRSRWNFLTKTGPEANDPCKPVQRPSRIGMDRHPCPKGHVNPGLDIVWFMESTCWMAASWTRSSSSNPPALIQHIRRW